jgi:Calcineurin-like phosphoesterase
MRRLLAAATVLAVALVATLTAAGSIDRSRTALTIAVIGDTPYGPEQLTAFPALVGAVNADPDEEAALHLGDIKNGSSLCTDAYFEQIHGLFESFRDPLLFTPGDNEWTDCHRANNGSYLPTERLAKLRATFFPKPGRSLGRRTKFVDSQAEVAGFAPYVENQLWKQSKVVFSMVHVVGSNNDLVPWFGAAETAEQRALRLAEYDSRLAAALDWLDRTFALAASSDARGVVVAMQADMWSGAARDGFNAIVQRLADRASAFGRPVLLLEGDTHDYLVDQPLAGGSPTHGVSTAAPNVTRVVVEGETASEWLRLTVDPRAAQLFSWERVFVP